MSGSTMKFQRRIPAVPISESSGSVFARMPSVPRSARRQPVGCDCFAFHIREGVDHASRDAFAPVEPADSRGRIVQKSKREPLLVALDE